MSDIHYLDNSATTCPSDIARRAMTEAMEIWGNPSSTHSLGLEAKNLLEDSRRKLLKTLGLPKFTDDRLCITASGTEANNIAILGCAHSKVRGDVKGTVIISAGEHPSVDLPSESLRREGYDIVKIPTAGGVLDLGYLEDSLINASSPVIFAGFMLVNNETGAIYDVKGASDLVKRYYPDANVHCDAVQGYMKLNFTPKSLGADTLTVSAHKIHSYRGAAALYISSSIIKRRNISPVMPGGGQENGLRSGTENLCAISAFAAAAEDASLRMTERVAHMKFMREELDRLINDSLIPLGVTLNLPEKHVDSILNISLPGIKSETMLNYLSAKGVYVSAGSACAANSKKKSAALEAFGCSSKQADSAIRLSLGDMTTADDITVTVASLAEGIKTLQRMR